MKLIILLILLWAFPVNAHNVVCGPRKYMVDALRSNGEEVIWYQARKEGYYEFWDQPVSRAWSLTWSDRKEPNAQMCVLAFMNERSGEGERRARD